MLERQIRDAVKEIIEKYGTSNVYDLIDCLDIQFYKRKLGDKLNGLFVVEKEIKFIYINDSLDTNTERWVLAHEIGHAVLHDGDDCNFLCHYAFYDKGKFEKEADLFAADLLLPDDPRTEYDCCTNEHIAQVEGIPVELVNMKYRELLN